MDTHAQSPVSVAGRWRELRRHGWGTLAYRGVRRLVERGPGSGHWDFCIHQIITVAPWRLRLPPRLARGLSVRELGEPDLEALEQLRPALGMPYRQRMAEAHRGLGAWLDQRLVAFIWLRRGPALLPASFGCVWQLSAPMAWLYDLYSDPEVLGAAPHLYDHLRRHPPGDGVQLLVGQTDYDNVRSRWAHRTLGYEVRATLWSWRLGRWQLHWWRSPGPREWRWRCGQARIPLHRFASVCERREGRARMASGTEPLRLQCRCGREVQASGAQYTCVCGRCLGTQAAGLALVGKAIPYWGEIPQDAMQAVLEEARTLGWQAAVRKLLPPALADYVSASSRAAFHELLPLPHGARILDVGAGWGGIAARLAEHYQVVALEGVAERARFIALRQQQDRLERLQVVNGDVHQTPLALGQYDAIVANGILEWVALMDTTAPPTAVQSQFLSRLRDLLAPQGMIYLAIENRFGWAELRGALDHSGLPYTSLLPRPLARWVCALSPHYRANFNVGYRTYTYSHRGYARLFADAGLEMRAAWISPMGYNQPERLIPLNTAAIRFGQRQGADASPRRWAKRWLAQAGVWRRIGSDFVFLLQARQEAGFGLEPWAAAAQAGPGTGDA